MAAPKKHGFKKCPECGTEQKSNVARTCHNCGHVFEKKSRVSPPARKARTRRSAAQKGEASGPKPPSPALDHIIPIDLAAWPKTAKAIRTFGGEQPTAFFLNAFDLESRLAECEARLS